MFMSRRKTRIAVSILAVTACTAVVSLACGPEFSILLFNRKATLHGPIGSDFDRDAAAFAPAPKVKFTVGTGSENFPTEPDQARAEVEQSGLSAKQREALLAMRAAPDGDAAYALGASLPKAVRLYTAGAVDFRHGHLSPDDYDGEFCAEMSEEECVAAQASAREAQEKAQRRAVARFKAALDLPEADARPRATWAAFSLGRILADAGHDDEARAAFRRTRELVARGFPDPLGLAEASLGEEARQYLRTDEYARAAALYAEQAAHGSVSGKNSLRVVAETLLAAPGKLTANIADPLIQKIVVNYVLDQGDNNWTATLGLTYFTGGEAPHPSKFGTLADAIAALGPAHIAQADRLAALAYDTGRYELAASLAKQAQGPLAAWVQAKLAIRRGDGKAAARYYAEAAKAFPQIGEGIAGNTRQPRLLLGERAVLTLARGEYTQALAQFYGVGGHYWPDLAYVAERVVTTDELKAFVDANVAKPPLPKVEKSTYGSFALPDQDAEWPAFSVAAQLRDLLARRLVREGRIADAGPYFHDVADKRFAQSYPGEDATRVPDSRADSEAYGKALRSADKAWTGIGRARELYAAARLARIEGMSMMGYELAPDFFIVGGGFEFDVTAPDPKGRNLIGKDEPARFSATVARPDKRFHYRHIAADLAIKAAETLPHRSQAYAAVLCQAAGWVVNQDGKKADEIYRLYVKNGASVAWATHFGRNCPAPEFGRAAMTEAWSKATPLKRHPHRTAGGLAAIALMLAGAWWYRRRKKAPQPA